MPKVSFRTASASLVGIRSTELAWLAHIGIDRAFGLGLKYPTAFNDRTRRRFGHPVGLDPWSATS